MHNLQPSMYRCRAFQISKGQFARCSSRTLSLSPPPNRRFSSSSSSPLSKSDPRQNPGQSIFESTGLLTGKQCLITGASRGIGNEIARRFASEGARCILVGRDEEILLSVKRELEEENLREDSGHRVVVGDVGDEGFWGGFSKERNIEILVNAAGVTHFSPFVVTQQNLIEKVLRTNLMGAMLACRVVGKNMLANRNGCIINVASLLGLKGGRGSAAYVASKAGIIGLTRALAAELGEKNVRVNVVVPGYIDTDMTKAMTPEARSVVLNTIPLKRFGQASEIADAAIFLVKNKYANNCVLNLDGGLSAI